MCPPGCARAGLCLWCTQGVQPATCVFDSSHVGLHGVLRIEGQGLRGDNKSHDLGTQATGTQRPVNGPEPSPAPLSLQDLAWLMEAHRKELADAHRKNQDLVTQVRQQVLRPGGRGKWAPKLQGL
jgi:hypothetical protein